MNRTYALLAFLGAGRLAAGLFVLAGGRRSAAGREGQAPGP
jgi:hypothetical protein